MRRFLLALVLIVAAAVGAAGYAAYATDREYARLIAAGDAAAVDGDEFRALQAYTGAVTLRPGSMLAHLKRGATYRRRGEFDAALRDLRQASALDPMAPLALELLGDTYAALGRPDRAVERYRAYLAVDDRSAAIWGKLGLALYRARELGPATEALERAASLEPSSAEHALVLGLCRRDAGDWPAARHALETATRLAPALIAAREALAGVYDTTGQPARAIDQLEALAALDPANPDRFAALGLAYARGRRFEAGVLTLSRAVERFPDHPRVYGALGRLWLDTALAQPDRVSLKKAVQALGTAAAHPDVSSDTLTALGQALMLSGDPSGAERVLRQAVSRLPAAPDAYLHLATIAAGANRLQDARNALVRYAAIKVEGMPLAAVATRIADYSLGLGQPAEALRWIDRAIDDGGETPALARLRLRALAMTTP